MKIYRCDDCYISGYYSNKEKAKKEFNCDKKECENLYEDGDGTETAFYDEPESESD